MFLSDIADCSLCAEIRQSNIIIHTHTKRLPNQSAVIHNNSDEHDDERQSYRDRRKYDETVVESRLNALITTMINVPEFQLT